MRKWLLLLASYSTATFSQALPVPAIINAKNQALLASPMGGIIKEVTVREGSFFKKGMILVEFECAKQQAELEKENAVLFKKESIYEGYQRLLKLKGISQIELKEAKADYLEAKALAKIAADKVKDCTVKAPFDGQVIELLHKAHEHATLSKPLLEIVSATSLEIKIIAPSSWLRWIKKGMTFKVAVQESNQTYQAKVVRFNHYIDPVSRTFSIFGEFSEQQPLVSPGMSGQAIFKEAQ